MKTVNSLEIFQNVLESSPHAILIINAFEQTIIYYNPMAKTFFGEDLDRIIEKETYIRLLQEKEAEFQLTVSTQGSIRIGAVSVRSMSWDRTPNDYRILYVNDITETENGKKDSFLDELTGIPRRNLFQHRLEEAITLASANKGIFGLLYLDLDGFKPINDTFGHTSGDMVLKIVTKRIKACIREGDTVGRLGGDEFGIILLNVQTPENMGIIAKKIIESLEQEIKLESDQNCFISASIGVSIFPEDGANYDTLIENADRAMYVVKHDRGKGAYAYYSDGIVDQYQNKKKIEDGIRNAINHPDEFILHYMPQVEIKSGKLSAIEALTYWKPEDGKLRFPNDFIPVANRSNAIIAIEQIAFTKAGRNLVAWLKQQGTTTPFRLAINLSNRHFNALESMETLNQLIEDIGISPSLLDLEITESIMVHDPKAIEILFELRQQHVSLTLDNYGSQATSLLSLKRFPISAIKIDRLFVRNILEDKIDRAIVKNTICMANDIGLRTIAQGVESEAQLELLQDWGCDEAQGYLFSKLLPAGPFSRYIQTFKPAES